MGLRANARIGKGPRLAVVRWRATPVRFRRADSKTLVRRGREKIVKVPHYCVTIGPEHPEQYSGAPTPTWIIDAADEAAARDHAEVMHRRDHPEVAALRIRPTVSTHGR
jgi:hypothetical protein